MLPLIRILLLAISLTHLVELSMDLPFIFDFLPSNPILLHLFPVLNLLHLLEEKVLVGFLLLLPPVELFLCDVFEHVGGLHVHDLLFLGRVCRSHCLCKHVVVSLVSVLGCRTEILCVRRLVLSVLCDIVLNTTVVL